MGLYDGLEGNSNVGSTAEMAKWLGAPVLLVLDCAALARSAAAMAQGYQVLSHPHHPAAVSCLQLLSRSLTLRSDAECRISTRTLSSAALCSTRWVGMPTWFGSKTPWRRLA